MPEGALARHSAETTARYGRFRWIAPPGLARRSERIRFLFAPRSLGRKRPRGVSSTPRVLRHGRFGVSRYARKVISSAPWRRLMRYWLGREEWRLRFPTDIRDRAGGRCGK